MINIENSVFDEIKMADEYVYMPYILRSIFIQL